MTSPKTRWNYVGAGLLVLVVASYLDNVRGPILPAVSKALGVGYGSTAWFLVAGNLAAVGCTFLLIFLTRRISERAIACGFGFVAIAATLFSPFVDDFTRLVVLAIGLGSAIAVLGALCNVFVIHGTTLDARARAFCGLHMMYGFGSLLAPGTAGVLLERGFRWQAPLLVSIPGLIAMAVYLYVALPPQHRSAETHPGNFRVTRVNVLMLFAIPLYVAAEVMVSMWMTPFLVEEGLHVGAASKYLLGFFLTMGVTRALCFLSLKPQQEAWFLWGSLIFGAVFFSLGRAGWYWGFALTGVLGPFFPLFLARVTRAFSKDSAALTLAIITAMQVILAVFHLSIGNVSDRLGMSLAYWMPVALIGAALVALGLYIHAEGVALRSRDR